MIQPAFHTDGRLIGFAANILHHTDVGGMRPGSQAVEGVSDFFQEGLHVPPVKLWRAGEEQEGILARAVLRDVAEDYVSLEGARRDYGVVIDPVTMTVDETATRAARAAMDRPDPPPIVTRLGPLW